MTETSHKLLHPIGVILVVGTAIAVSSELAAPSTGPSREGLLEHLSHSVLATTTCLWVAAAIHVGRGHATRTIAALGVAAYLALLLLEEMDWGAVYGFTWFSDQFEDAIGVPSLHHSRSRADNVGSLVPKLYLFAIPGLLWFLVPRLRLPWVDRLRRALDPLLPTPSESLWFFLAVLTKLLVTTSTHALIDFYQLVVYLLFGFSAWRVLGTTSSAP